VICEAASFWLTDKPEPVERIESFVNLSLVANFYNSENGAWEKLFKVETPERLFRPDGSLVE
jgi:hypothetical protein